MLMKGQPGGSWPPILVVTWYRWTHTQDIRPSIPLNSVQSSFFVHHLLLFLHMALYMALQMHGLNWESGHQQQPAFIASRALSPGMFPGIQICTRNYVASTTSPPVLLALFKLYLWLEQHKRWKFRWMDMKMTARNAQDVALEHAYLDICMLRVFFLSIKTIF